MDYTKQFPKGYIKEQQYKPKGIVISLYDFTGEALKPWANDGYECYAYDIQHNPHETTKDYYSNGGSIEYVHADLHDQKTLTQIHDDFYTRQMDGGPRVVFGMSFVVCTHLAVSGASHYAAKAKINPNFQTDAANYAIWCADLFDSMDIPYFIENPVSVLATLWRKPNYYFHPYEYGGYISYSEAEHPRWPEYIAPMDAYTKKTCLWTGGGFVMPQKVAVDKPTGYSTQHLKLGGKSQRTKDIRSATPRGFAIAVHDANKVIDNDHFLMREAFDSNGKQIERKMIHYAEATDEEKLAEFDKATDDAIRDKLETEGVV